MIGWQMPARIGCGLCYSAGEAERGGGGRAPAGLGSAESRDGVRGCFCFEMAGFERDRAPSGLARQRHAVLVGPDRRPVSAAARGGSCPRRAARS